MVTSSAVVGSSAISSLGWHDRAIAIMTRCRMPPDIWCGYSLDAAVRIGDADIAQRLLGDLVGLRGLRRPDAA